MIALIGNETDTNESTKLTRQLSKGAEGWLWLGQRLVLMVRRLI